MTATGKNKVTGDEALGILLEGNRRFSRHEQRYPHQGIERRADAERGQKPLAAVLGCADSRVPPELIFDQGIGDVFVLRTAGHVADGATLGSIEYAVGHLEVPLLVVLGHSDCGAVKAALGGEEQGDGNVRHVTHAIKPALSGLDVNDPDIVDQVAKIHAALTARRLGSLQPVLSESVEAGRFKIVAGFYSLNTGVVEILS